MIRTVPIITPVIITYNNLSNDSYGSKPSGGSYGSSKQDSYGSNKGSYGSSKDDDSYGSSNQDSYGSKGSSKENYGDDSYGSSKTSSDDNNYGSSNNDSYGSSNTSSGKKPSTDSDDYGSSNAQPPQHGKGSDFITDTLKSTASKAGYNLVSLLPPNNSQRISSQRILGRRNR